MAKQIIIGLCIMILGACLMYFSASLVEMFGTIDWAERHVGGTRNGYLLVGCILVVLGVLFFFGVIPSSSTQQLPTLTPTPTSVTK